MNEFNDELFTGGNYGETPRAAQTERKRADKPPRARSAAPKKADINASRRENATGVNAKKTSDDPKIYEPECSGVLETVEKACNGNRYLEAMVLGEILNEPRFKKYRR